MYRHRSEQDADEPQRPFDEKIFASDYAQTVHKGLETDIGWFELPGIGATGERVNMAVDIRFWFHNKLVGRKMGNFN